jgi:hypothetical protein
MLISILEFISKSEYQNCAFFAWHSSGPKQPVHWELDRDQRLYVPTAEIHALPVPRSWRYPKGPTDARLYPRFNLYRDWRCRLCDHRALPWRLREVVRRNL